MENGSGEYLKRISVPFLESSRSVKGSWDSFNFLQVSRMRLRKESKLWRPKETRLSTLTLLFSPSLSALDFPYFQLFWIYPRQCRMVQAAGGLLPLRKMCTGGSIPSGLPVGWSKERTSGSRGRTAGHRKLPADPGQVQMHCGAAGDFRGNAFPSISAG